MGISPEETITPKDICTLMFTAALFTIARTRKQPKCPSTEQWVRKTCGIIYTMEYYPATTKGKIMPFAATWIDIEIFILSEVCQTEKHRI